MQNFIANHISQGFVKVVQNMAQKFCDLGCDIRIKINFFYVHIHFFLEKFGQMSEVKFNQTEKIEHVRGNVEYKHDGQLLLAFTETPLCLCIKEPQLNGLFKQTDNKLIFIFFDILKC